LPDYLPLCVFRQGLLPPDCRRCAWWQTSTGRPDPDAAVQVRGRWLPSVEEQWGAAGILLYEESQRLAASRSTSLPAGSMATRGSVHFAPLGSLPRFRTLGFGDLADEAGFLFCLRYEGDGAYRGPKRLVLRALAELRKRGVHEVYAVAEPSQDSSSPRDCRFFSPSLLAACGFEHVGSSGTLYLMRADIRGLIHIAEQLRSLLKRLVHNHPTPSPAAWSRPRTTERPRWP